MPLAGGAGRTRSCEMSAALAVSPWWPSASPCHRHHHRRTAGSQGAQPRVPCTRAACAPPAAGILPPRIRLSRTGPRYHPTKGPVRLFPALPSRPGPLHRARRVAFGRLAAAQRLWGRWVLKGPGRAGRSLSRGWLRRGAAGEVPAPGLVGRRPTRPRRPARCACVRGAAAPARAPVTARTSTRVAGLPVPVHSRLRRRRTRGGAEPGPDDGLESAEPTPESRPRPRGGDRAQKACTRARAHACTHGAAPCRAVVGAAADRLSIGGALPLSSRSAPRC